MSILRFVDFIKIESYSLLVFSCALVIKWKSDQFSKKEWRWEANTDRQTGRHREMVMVMVMDGFEHTTSFCRDTVYILYVYREISVQIDMYVCMYAMMYICTHMYVCMCVYVCICTHTLCTYVYVCIDVPG